MTHIVLPPMALQTPSAPLILYWKVDQNTHGSQPTNRLRIGSLIEQLERGPKELKMFAVLQEEQHMYQPVLPEIPGAKPPTKECAWRDPWLQMHKQQRMTLLDIKGRRGPGKAPCSSVGEY